IMTYLPILKIMCTVSVGLQEPQRQEPPLRLLTKRIKLGFPVSNSSLKEKYQKRLCLTVFQKAPHTHPVVEPKRKTRIVKSLFVNFKNVKRNSIKLLPFTSKNQVV